MIDAETAAVDYFGPDPEGLLMAPVYAGGRRLLDRNGLIPCRISTTTKFMRPSAARVLCTLAAWEDESYCRRAPWGAPRHWGPSIGRASM